jgi:hypothetical protein
LLRRIATEKFIAVTPHDVPLHPGVKKGCGEREFKV